MNDNNIDNELTDNTLENENLENKDLSFEKQIQYSGTAYNKDPLPRRATLMTDDIYIKERLDSQIEWYNNKASESQKKYKILRRWEIVIASSIPVLIGFSPMSFLENLKLMPHLSMSTVFQILAAVGGVIIIVLKGFNDLEDYYKNWKEYRGTNEALKQERFKYLTRTEPYDELDAYPILVEKIESILKKEIQNWRVVSKPSNEISQKALDSIANQMNKLQEISDAKNKTKNSKDKENKEA